MLYDLIKVLKLTLVIIIIICTSCSDQSSIKNEDIVLVVNDLKMTKSEFLDQFVADMEYSEKMDKDTKLKKEILDRIIRKELLIQEAKKRGLDKDKKFITAIERYWEATLIKQLMEQKNTEIQKNTSVSNSEIKEKYEAYKKTNPDLPPLDQVKKEISQEILTNKKAAVFENWVQALYRQANIKIDDKIINE